MMAQHWIVPFLIIALLHWCACETTINRLENLTLCQHNLTGAVDLVLLMDRSNNMNQETFNDVQAFAVDISKRYMVINPNKTRVAVILFGPDVTEAINYISRDPPVYGCEFFHERGPFRTEVTFHNMASDSHSNSTETDALHRAGQVMHEGRQARRGVSQIVWLMTEYNHQARHHDPLKNITRKLQKDGVLVFGHGKGLEELVSQPDYCYFDNGDSVALLDWSFKTPRKSSPGNWRNMTMPAVCNDTCSWCQCQEFGSAYRCLRTRPQAETTTTPNKAVTDSPKGKQPWYAWKHYGQYLAYGAIGLFIIAVCCTCICICCNTVTIRNVICCPMNLYEKVGNRG